MQIPHTAVPLSTKTIEIAPHVLAELSEIGVKESRVKAKVLALAGDPESWKPVEKWAVAKKKWELTHARNIRERCCYAKWPSNRLTLHPIVRPLLQRVLVSVTVELSVDFYEDRGALRATVNWFAERSPRSSKPKPR